MFKIRTRRIIHSGIRIMHRSKFRTIAMMLSIVIGITTLTLTINIGNGIEKKIMDNVSRFIQPQHLIVLSENTEAEGIRQKEDSPNTTFKIEDVEAIANQLDDIILYDYAQVLPEKEVSYKDNNHFTTVKGCRPIGQVVWNKPIAQGRFFDEADLKGSKRVAVLGPKLAKILFNNEDPIGKTFKISSIPFTVIGIAEAQGADPHGADLDDELAIPITTLMRRVANVDYILAAKFEFPDETASSNAEPLIREILRERHSINEGEADDFNILSPVQVKKIVGTMINIFKVLLPSISAIALFAGVIIIIVLMNIAVNQRAKEIGIRKAIGAKDNDINKQFLSESAAVVIIGGSIGLVFGLLLSKLVSSKLNATFFISIQTIVVGIFIPIIIGLIAGILPAKKAAKLNPIENIK